MKIQVPLIALGLVALNSCTIIINGGGPTPPPPGGGFNPCITTPESEAMPAAHLIMNVRIDRTVVNFEAEYARWMRTAVLGLWAANIRTERAVMLRLDEGPGSATPLGAWGCEAGGFDLDPQAVIHHYAVEEDAARSPSACALDPLLFAGRDLGALVTSYPPQLSAPSGVKAFGRAPDLVVVMHLDSLARASGLSDPACSSASAFSAQDESGVATWLNYPQPAKSGLSGVMFDRVFHWFVATDEAVDDATFLDRCRRVEGFPSTILDLIEPSPRSLYDPLAAQIDGSGGAAARQSFCSMFAEADRAEFFQRELGIIASRAGTSIDPERLAAALSGEVPVPEVDPRGGQ